MAATGLELFECRLGWVMAPDSLLAGRFSRTVLGYDVRSLLGLGSLSKFVEMVLCQSGRRA
jgi:hypothetical protein